MARVIRSRQARRDTLKIWVSIAEQNMPAADAMVNSFTEALDQSVRFAGRGPARDELRPGLRSFPVRPYLLFYKQVPDGIELVRVIHGAQDLRRLFPKGRGPA